MALPEKHIASLEEAVAELKRDPRRAVHARVGNLDVEIRVVADETGASTDIFAGAGPWQAKPRRSSCGFCAKHATATTKTRIGREDLAPRRQYARLRDESPGRRA